MNEKKQNLLQLFASVENYFSPKIVGEVNDAFIKIAKVKGSDVPWHTHDNEDEMFFVFKGQSMDNDKRKFRRNLPVGRKK